MKLLPDLLLLAAVLVPTTATSGVIFEASFADCQDTDLPDGWVVSGRQEAVLPEYSGLFPGDKGEPWYVCADIEGHACAWSCSSYMSNAQADQWLITPPITVSGDMILTFKTTAYGRGEVSDYRVMAADDIEEGVGPEMFVTTPVMTGKVYGSAAEYRSETTHSPVYADRPGKIRLAFVNRSHDAGLLGFSDILLEPYHLDITNVTPTVLPAGRQTQVNVNVTAYTPRVVNGLTATLDVEGQAAQTKRLSGRISAGGRGFDIVFDEPLVMTEDGIEYTVTVTPDCEGAEPTVIKGQISAPTTLYTPTVVIEEFTGTWCLNCVRGMAFMEYYSDLYHGRDGGPKAIAIALHNADGMAIPGEEYRRMAMEASGQNGYPGAYFNRSVGGDPSDAGTVARLLEQSCYSSIKATRVDADGDMLNVSYSIRNAFTTPNLNQRVAFVIVEDNVSGIGQEYMQRNGLSGVSRDVIEDYYGADLWPYFERYCRANNVIPFNEIEYNHVARGIYPNYYGLAVSLDYTADTPIDGEYAFRLPDQIVDPSNISVVAILMDGETGSILAAERVEAENFGQNLNAVNQVEYESSPVLVHMGTQLALVGCDRAEVELRDVSGQLVDRVRLMAGQTMELPDRRGVYLCICRTGERTTVQRVIR